MFCITFEIVDEIIKVKSDFNKIIVLTNGAENNILKNAIENMLTERMVGAYHVKKYGNINIIMALKELFGENTISIIDIEGEIEVIPYENNEIY